MANVFIQDSTMRSIADAIREKTGKSDSILPAIMPGEIQSIETGGSLDDVIVLMADFSDFTDISVRDGERDTSARRIWA